MRWYKVEYKCVGGWWVSDSLDKLPTQALHCILRNNPATPTNTDISSIRAQAEIELYIREHNLRS